MWARVRERAPSVAALFARRPSVLDHVVFTGLVASGATALLVLDAGTRPAGCLAWLFFALTATQIGAFIGAAGVIVRAATFGRVGWGTAQAIGATVTLGVLAIERAHHALAGRFLDRGGLQLAWEAMRTGDLPVDMRSVAIWLGVAVFACLLFVIVLYALAHVPRSDQATAIAWATVPYALLAIATLGALRDIIFDQSSVAWSRVRDAIPWDSRANGTLGVAGAAGPGADDAQKGARQDGLWSAASDEHLFRLVQSRRSRLHHEPIAAKTTPDVLVLHVEGLRFDMLRDDVAPNLVAFARECLSPERHYSTGNNTGGGMFGLLNGLSGSYYALARKAHAQPIPLEVLRRLGYSESVYFVTDLLKYEGIYDLYFKGLVDYTYRRPDSDATVDAADAHMVDAYLATRVARPDNRPYFDYLVFDSTHYDYRYPPAFERFTPVDTLGRGAEFVIMRPGIDAELRPRGPAVRNRYKNSILYVDSLLRRILDALRSSGALDKTVVVITGDHGEEFWEEDAFGHGNALHDAQIRVVFLMHLPGNPTTNYGYGSHADVMPTVFDYMGVKTSEVAFMSGKSLLRYDPTLDVAVTAEGVTGDHVAFFSAVMTEGQKFVFRNKEPFAILESRSPVDDHILPSYDADLAAEAVLRGLASKELR